MVRIAYDIFGPIGPGKPEILEVLARSGRSDRRAGSSACGCPQIKHTHPQIVHRLIHKILGLMSQERLHVGEASVSSTELPLWSSG